MSYFATDCAAAASHASNLFESVSTSPARRDFSRFDEAYASRRASTSRTFAS